jgi:putative FmdB family regulatory protein
VPIYDYVCGSCGHRFEVLRGINEAGPHQCPECGGPVARAFVPPTIHFKGTGWAKTDRRAAGAPAHRSETSSPASGSPASSAGGGSGTGAGSPGTNAGSEGTQSTTVVPPTKSAPADAER